MTLADWPGSPPVGASNKPQDIIGRGVITPIYAKEPVIDSRLAPKAAGGGLASLIPPGMRAVAVRVNEVVGVAGFVTPGMRVDVLISGNRPGGDGDLGTLTRTLLQNLEVLSAGQDIKKDAEGKPIAVQVVNLLVTPEQAEQLSLAIQPDHHSVVLRNPLDREIAVTPGTALSLLFTGSKLSPERKRPPLRPPQPRPRAVMAAPRPPRVEAAAPPKKEAPVRHGNSFRNKKTDSKFDPNSGGK